MKPAFILIVSLCAFLAGLNGQTQAVGQDLSNYVLQPRDVIRVEIFQEPDVGREVRLAADGTVSLPLIGEIKVAGMTVRDARTLMTDLYNRDFFVEPQLSILVLEYTQRRLQVLGQVNSPGLVVIPPEEGMTLSQAIAAARGLTNMARRNDIRIRRKIGEEIQMIEINYDDLLRNPQASDIEVIDGDIISVETRRI